MDFLDQIFHLEFLAQSKAHLVHLKPKHFTRAVMTKREDKENFHVVQVRSIWWTVPQ